MSLLSCSIVAYGQSAEELGPLVEALMSSPAVGLVTIVDNSPEDRLGEAVGRWSCRYIRPGRNIGFGAGHNLALREALAAGSDYHLILNPDISFRPGTIESLVEYMDANPRVGLLMPRILNPDGSLQYLCKLLPTPLDLFSRRFLFFLEAARKRNERFELRYSGYDRIMRVPYLSGCCMLIRTAALREVGLFDEGIFLYGEDTDLTRRIGARYDTIFYPHATVTHTLGKGSYKSLGLLWIHVKSTIYYFNKWGWFFDAERRAVNRRTIDGIRDRRLGGSS